MPAARVATNSLLFDMRENAKMAPSSTANGINFCAISGSFSRLMPRMMSVGMPRSDVRVKRSARSMDSASAANAPKTIITDSTKRRAR